MRSVIFCIQHLRSSVFSAHIAFSVASAQEHELLLQRLEPSSEARVYSSEWFGIQLVVPANSIAEARPLRVTIIPAFEGIGTEVVGNDGRPYVIWSPVLRGCGEVVLQAGKSLQLRFSTCPCSECRDNPAAIFRQSNSGDAGWTEVEGSQFDAQAMMVTAHVASFSGFVLAKSVNNSSGIGQHLISRVFDRAHKSVAHAKLVVNGYKDADKLFVVISQPVMAISTVTQTKENSAALAPAITVGTASAQVGELRHTSGSSTEYQQVTPPTHGEQPAYPMKKVPLHKMFGPDRESWVANPAIITAGGSQAVKVYMSTRTAAGIDVWWHESVEPLWAVLIRPPLPLSPASFPAELEALNYSRGSATLDVEEAADDAVAERHARIEIKRKLAAAEALRTEALGSQTAAVP
ncbi:hypothetical protein JKP88DRAFT_246718 [Tribonema minus]|uniref:Uncharacterized protein n=1 Tax=Tribonema minus TaxID=303371 RepID=A0A835YV17_9STRA|nr:hypothetical protein JKP88DRAFT_246718 [Tribonema minus]